MLNKTRFVFFCQRFIYYLFASLMTFILLANINSDIALSNNILFVFAAVIIFFAFVIPDIRKLFSKVGQWLMKSKKFLIVVIASGFLLRLLPILCDFTWILADDQGDCAIHFFGSQQLAFDGMLNPNNARYEAVFIQLYSYTLTLSFFVRIFKNITVAIVFSNILFDAIAIVFLSKVLLLAKKNVNIGIILWCINPFFIVMCWFPMAVTIVNCILMISIYIGYCLLKTNANGKFSIVPALLFGVVIFIGNLFRPLFYVVMIAVLISLFLYMLTHITKIKQTIVIALTIVFVTLLLGEIYYSQFTSVGGFQVPDSKIGWNFFVGANYASKGAWSPEDNYYFWCDLLVNVTPSEAEEILFSQGIERYASMSIYQLFTHIVNKFTVLFADVGNAVRDLRWTFQISDGFYNRVSDSLTVYYLLLITSVFINCYKSVRAKIFSWKQFFPMITFVGFSMAYMLVEVMNRYSSMLVALLIVVIGLQSSSTVADNVGNENALD